MALIKAVTLATGVRGDYHRIASFRWERPNRECSVLVALYLNAATAQAGGQPIAPIFAKLRLTEEKFDEVVGPEQLPSDRTMLAVLYEALAAASRAVHDGDESFHHARAHVICDYGNDFYWDAAAG